MTSKGLKTINFKYMKKLIEKIKAKFSRKPLLVIPDVSESFDVVKFTNCNFIQTENIIDETEEFIKTNDGDTFDKCTFYIRKGRAAINFR